MSTTLDPTVANMEGEAALPRDNGELVFAAPWQGRSLALAIALVDELGLEWDDFRERLIEAIAEDPVRPYYESWTAALESLVLSLGIADTAELTARAIGVVPPD